MPLDNNEALSAAIDAISEPVRAALLAAALAGILALKADDRSIYKRCVEVAAVFGTGLIAGYGMQAAGLDSWVIWGANATVAYLGVDKVRAITDRVVDGILTKRGV